MGAEEPWVIFSNAAFIGRPETGMRYYNSRQDSKATVYDHYTGVGEVLAVHSLDDVFGLWDTDPRQARQPVLAGRCQRRKPDFRRLAVGKSLAARHSRHAGICLSEGGIRRRARAISRS